MWTVSSSKSQPCRACTASPRPKSADVRPHLLLAAQYGYAKVPCVNPLSPRSCRVPFRPDEADGLPVGIRTRQHQGLGLHEVLPIPQSSTWGTALVVAPTFEGVADATPVGLARPAPTIARVANARNAGRTRGGVMAGHFTGTPHAPQERRDGGISPRMLAESSRCRSGPVLVSSQPGESQPARPSRRCPEPRPTGPFCWHARRQPFPGPGEVRRRMLAGTNHMRGRTMDNEAAMRHFLEEINAGDVNAAAELLADSFVEHEVLPGLEPNKEGTRQLFGMMIAAFPDLRFDAQDILTSGDKVVARSALAGPTKVSSWARRRLARPSTCRPSTSCASVTTVSQLNTGVSWT